MIFSMPGCEQPTISARPCGVLTAIDTSFISRVPGVCEFVEKSQKMAQVGDTLEEAYEIACKSVSREDLICITGSIYLVGLAKRLQAAGKLQ